MIRIVSTPEQKERFSSLICGVPYFQAVMATDLALWAENPGAPVRLYLAGKAALSLQGRKALLCGRPDDWEEITAFLQYAGAAGLLCDGCPPAPWTPEAEWYIFSLPAGQRLPLLPLPEGLCRNEAPSVYAVAKLLFGGDEAGRDYFYTVACTSINHGFGCCRTLEREGQVLSTVGCYERGHGEAYMSAGMTAPALRGQGLGGWLIASLANDLSAEGWNVTFLCAEERRRFYRRLGFYEIGRYLSYQLKDE
ncbi:MAG: GNAT family N-acetyltransferase [Gemmiger sp.]